jgi:hypothetical protein
MLLHITQRSEDDLTVVALAGHLVQEGVAELERLCQAVPSPLALDGPFRGVSRAR